jgi:elongation factor G
VILVVLIQINVLLPQVEMQNFIIELRSLVLGMRTFTWRDDHLQKVPEKLTHTFLPSTDNNRN